jgi:tetratricopeptide (TPR) repeat protein
MSFTYHDIDNYLAGEMDAATLLQFETQLKTDVHLQQQVANYKMMMGTISKHQQAAQTLPDLKAILQPLTQQHFAKQQQKAKVISIRRMVYTFAAAACIAALILIMMPGVNIDNYPVDDMSGAIVRGKEDDMAKAAQLFNNKNYEAAVIAFQKLQAANSTDVAINYHLGISYIKTKKDKEALPVFEALANGPSAYKEDANFFAALSAYHLNEKATATTYAQKVLAGSKYYKHAKEIIKKFK